MLAAIVLSSLSAPFQPALDWTSPRTLPSLVTAWRHEGEVCALAVRDRVVYVLEEARVLALDSRDGSVLWSRPIDEASCGAVPERELHVLPDRLLVVARRNLYSIRLSDGTLENVRTLDGLGYLWGSLLVVHVVDHSDGDTVFRIDEATGAVAFQWKAPGEIESLELEAEVAAVATSENDVPLVVGLRLPALEEIWRSRGFSRFRRVAESFCVEPAESDDAREPCLRIDFKTGRVGAPLTRLESESPAQEDFHGSKTLPWDLDLTGPDATPDLRRTDPHTGNTLWKVRLPSSLQTWTRSENTLFVHCGRAGRGDLVVIDFATGAVRGGAYGLRRVKRVVVDDERLLLLCDDGIVSASATVFGPPEALDRPLVDEVRRILAEKGLEHWTLDAPVEDLEALGPAALPFVVEEVPRLSVFPLEVAVQVFRRTGYRASIGALASRLSGELSGPRGQVENTRSRILELIRDWRPAEGVQAAAQALRDTSLPSGVRQDAFVALGAIASPDALTALEPFLTEPPSASSWWLPPSPQSYLDRVGLEATEDELKAAFEEEDYDAASRLTSGAGSTRVAFEDGSQGIVFQNAWLGSRSDLWLARVEGSGTLSAALFLDARGPETGADCFMTCGIAAVLAGDTLQVSSRDGTGYSVRIDLTAIAADSDADGLTDVVEKRLQTRIDYGLVGHAKCHQYREACVRPRYETVRFRTVRLSAR